MNASVSVMVAPTLASAVALVVVEGATDVPATTFETSPTFAPVIAKLTALAAIALVHVLVSTSPRRAVLVNVHTMFEPATVAAAFNETVRATKFTVAVPPDPRPVQEAPVNTNGTLGAVSVITVAAPGVVRICVAAETDTPLVIVVIFCATKPLVPVNAKVPTAPLLIFAMVTLVPKNKPTSAATAAPEGAATTWLAFAVVTIYPVSGVTTMVILPGVTAVA